MGQDFERVGKPSGGALRSGAVILLLGLVVAAGERSLAPLMVDRLNDRTAAEVRASDAFYRYAASYATEPDRLQDPLEVF